MNKNLFDLLTFMEKHRERHTQRELAEALQKSIGSVNKLITACKNAGYISGGLLTDKGLEALEPYRVKRAVFIAAGFGARLVPITLNTPKPLVRVKGQRIIDSLLDAVQAVGIEEIYIVRGYMAEQFDQLLYKYPTIQFLENPLYNESNNISSAVCARHFMRGAYVFEADLLLYNPDLITKYQYSSNYLGFWTEKTDDWCLLTQGGYIKKIALGGVNCYHLYGISYWTEEDGQRLATHLQSVYDSPGGKECFWDIAPLDHFRREYTISVRECAPDDLVEIDTYRELVDIDPSYRVGNG